MISLSVCFVNLCAALKHHRDSGDRFELVQNADDNCYQVDEPELCLSLHQTGAEQCFVGKSRQGISRYFKGIFMILMILMRGVKNFDNLFVLSLCGALVVHISPDVSSFLCIFSYRVARILVYANVQSARRYTRRLSIYTYTYHHIPTSCNCGLHKCDF